MLFDDDFSLNLKAKKDELKEKWRLFEEIDDPVHKILKIAFLSYTSKVDFNFLKPFGSHHASVCTLAIRNHFNYFKI